MTSMPMENVMNSIVDSMLDKRRAESMAGGVDASTSSLVSAKIGSNDDNAVLSGFKSDMKKMAGNSNLENLLLTTLKPSETLEQSMLKQLSQNADPDQILTAKTDQRIGEKSGLIMQPDVIKTTLLDGGPPGQGPMLENFFAIMNRSVNLK